MPDFDVEEPWPSNFDNENLFNFINSQKSLVKLSLHLIEITRAQLRIILNLSIEELDLFYCVLLNCHELDMKNTTIKKLSLSLLGIEKDNDDEIFACNLISSCMSAKSIELFAMEVTFEISYAIRKLNVESLKLDDCDMYVMNFPSLHTLEISLSRNINDHPIIRMNPQLKVLCISKNYQRDPKCVQAIEELNLDRFVVTPY